MRLSIWFAGALVAGTLGVGTARADEQQERAAIASEVMRMMDANDYAGLESLANSYREKALRTESGVWKLSQFYYGISNKFNMRDQGDLIWAPRVQWAEAWLKQSPSSPTAQVVAAQLQMNLAWAYRGTSGYAYKVEKERWAPFKDQVRVTGEYLTRVRKTARKDPHWYVLSLQVAKNGNVDDATFMTLFEEGIKRHPEYLPIYFEGVGNALPKWGGNPQKIDTLVRQSLRRVKARDRATLYTRMYWVASQNQYGNALFTRTLADWAVMKRGFDDMLKVYPSEWNLQAYTYFACAASDYAKARTLMLQMKQPADPEQWEERDFYDSCRRQAFALETSA